MNYFTLYWLNGDRKVVKGETIEQAFTIAGYGNGAIRAMDWYDNGITNSHYFFGGQWVKKTLLALTVQEFNKEATPENVQDIVNKLRRHDCIQLSFENKDILNIQDEIRHTGHDYVRVIQVGFCEYFPYPYCEDSNQTEHWMYSNTEFFDPAEPEIAVHAFLQRLNSNAAFESSSYKNVDLKMLASSQKDSGKALFQINN